MKWKTILSLLIVSVLLAGTLAMSAGTIPARGEDKQLVHTVEIGVHLDMDTAIMDIIDDPDLDLFMHSVDGVVWMQGPPVWFERLDTWEVHGSYNNLLLNPSREGDETDAMLEALDEGWIDEPDDVRWLANNADGDWTINPFAHNDIRFAMHYINRESLIEDMLDGLGTARYGWMDSRLPVWQERFVQSIERKYDFTPEGDEAFMEWIIEEAMEEIREEVAFGELTGSMDEGWYYEHEESGTDEHQIRIIGLCRIEDWRVDLGYRVVDMFEDMGFDARADERDGAGSIPLVFNAAPDPYDELTWHFYTGGWIATATVFWPHGAANQMYNPWVGFMHAQGPSEHWNYDQEGYRDTVGPSSRVRDQLEAAADAAGEDIWAHQDVTIEEMDAHGMDLQAARFDDIDEYWEMLTALGQRGIEEAVRVFLTTGIDFYPYDGESIGAMVIESVNGYDTYFGPRTMQVEDGELGATLLTGIDRPFMDNWNLYGGSADVYTIYPQRMMREKPNWAHPRTGLQQETINYWSEGPDLDPYQGEWQGEIYYGDDIMEADIEIEDHVIDYDPVANEWVQANEIEDRGEDGDEPRDYAYVRITYDTHEEHVWHCGSDFSIQDIMAWHARERRLAEEDNVDPDYEGIYHSTWDAESGPNFDSILGFEFDEEAGTYTVYTEYNFPDDSQIGSYHSYSPETHPLTYEVWDHLHGGTYWQDYAEDDWADDSWHYEAGRDHWIHQISGSQVRNAVIPIMEEMIEQEYVPPYYTEGLVPIEVDEQQLLDEMQNLVDFMHEYEHTYIGLGPFYMIEYDEETQTLHLERHEDYGFDFDQDWDPDSPYEDGYWSERFHIIELALTDMIVPRFVDMDDGPFEATTEGSMSELFPEIVDEPITEGDVDEYQYVLYDETGDEVAIVDEEDIELDEQATWSEFIADIPVTDEDDEYFDIGYYRLEFRALPEGEVAFVTISSDIILLFDPDLTAHTFDFTEDIGLDADDTATAEIDVEVTADQGDTAYVYLFDDETDEIVGGEPIAEHELGAGETWDDIVTHEFTERDDIGDYRAELRDEAGNILADDELTVHGVNYDLVTFDLVELPPHAQELSVDEPYGVAPHDVTITAEGYNPGFEATLNPGTNPGANILVFNHGNQMGEIRIELNGETVGLLELAGGTGAPAGSWLIDYEEALDYLITEPGEHTLQIIAEHGWDIPEGELPGEGEAAGEEVLEEVVWELDEDDLIEEIDLLIEEETVETAVMDVDETYTIEYDHTFEEPGIYSIQFGDLEEEVHVSILEVLEFTISENEIPVGDYVEVYAEIRNHVDTEETAYFYIGDDEIYNVTLGPGEDETVDFDTPEFEEPGDYSIDIRDEADVTIGSESLEVFPLEPTLEVVYPLEYELDEDEVTLTATVENIGYEDADDVELTLIDEDDETVDTWDFVVEGRSTKEIEATHTFEEPGEYIATLSSEYIDEHSVTITVEGELQWVDNLAVNGEEDELEIYQREEVEITATVENVGHFDYVVELMIDGEIEWDYTVEPGEELSIEEDYTFEESGEYEISLEDQSVTVAVEPTYQLSIEIEGDGTVTVEWNEEEETVTDSWSEYIPGGTDVTLTAEADDGWEFDRWELPDSPDHDGLLDEDEKEISFSMDDDKSTTAHFEEDTMELLWIIVIVVIVIIIIALVAMVMMKKPPEEEEFDEELEDEEELFEEEDFEDEEELFEEEGFEDEEELVDEEEDLFEEEPEEEL